MKKHRIFAQKRNDGNNTELLIYFAETVRRTRPADFRHEDDERGLAKDGRTTVAPRAGKDDHQPTDGYVDGYDGDLCRTVIIGHNGDDGVVRLGRATDAGTGHLGHHGCEHRHHADGVDHVVGL